MSTRDGYWQTNPDQVERARIMWEQGISTAQMGRLLGVSKGAVCGLKSRKGWKQRGPAIVSARADVGVRQRQRRVQALHIGPVSLPVLPSAAIVLPLEAARKPKQEPPNPVEAPRVVRRSNRQCQWLFGDKPFRRCEEMATPGYPYCAECCKRAFQNWRGAAVLDEVMG